ncbi:serine/arginine repetitive matrix protein 2-like isoform X2 [Portunus trituberculatus]|uniref:serine/arginine repetitive matrix protein 2-like isoform X2 n=1 Tax=Portunus trituberculatus TaxID=210409 RepID=UPI001E1CBA25|nr:serine/arginine repetitive matrix protein 2-like isoform X2 [Portunus trituberculatus]
MKDMNNSLASKDKTLKETLKSASSPRTSESRLSSVANGNANDLDHLQAEDEHLMSTVTPTAGDVSKESAESQGEAPPSTMSVGSLVEYLMSGPGRKAAKKLQKENNADRSSMVRSHMVHQVTTAGVHTPPPHLATPPLEVPEEQEPFVPDKATTMDEVVQLAIQNKDKVNRSLEHETQEQRQNDTQQTNLANMEDKNEAHSGDGDKDSSLSVATEKTNDTLQGSGMVSLASQPDESSPTESSVLTSATKIQSRPGSSDRAATSSRPPSSGRVAVPKRPDSKERIVSSSRRPSKDRATSSSRPTSKDRDINSNRSTSKDRKLSSSRPPSKDRTINSSRSTSRDRTIMTSRPTSIERAMSSSRPTSRDRGVNSSRPNSIERSSRSRPPNRPTSRERPPTTRIDKKKTLASVQEGREAATRPSRPTSRSMGSTEPKITIKETSVFQRPENVDHGLPPSGATKQGKSAPVQDKLNQERNVAKLYQRLIKKHVSGNKTGPSKEVASDKGPAMADHASKYRVQSQTPDLRDGSPLQPTREEVSVQQNDTLLVGASLSLNNTSSRPQTPKQGTSSIGDTLAMVAPQEGLDKESDAKQLVVQEAQPSRSLLSSMAEQNFLNSRSQRPESPVPEPKTGEQAELQNKHAASSGHSQEIKPLTALEGANQSTQVTEKSESDSQPESGKQPPTDQSITEDGVAASTTSVKDSGGKVPTLASVPSRAALSGSGENDAAGDPYTALPLIQGEVGTSSSVKTVVPFDPLKLPPHSEHGIIPIESSRGGLLPRVLDQPVPYVSSLRGDVLVKALEESARTNAGDRIHIPPPQVQGVMPYHVAPRGSSLSAVEVPEPTLSTVSLAVSKNTADLGRPMPLRDQGTGGIFDRFTSNASSTSLWHKITPLAVRPSNDAYYREPREYEDYLPREPPRPVLQRRNSLGKINTHDYEEDDDYYYEDDYNDNLRQKRVKESRGAQTVRVKNQQPRHGILKKPEPRPVKKEEPRNTILEKLEEYRNSPPIIIASGIVPKNLESLTSEYQATRGGESQKNGTKNHAPKEKEHFHDRHAETGTSVTAPLLASSGPKQSIGDVFDRLHNNRRLEHAALVSRRPELKQKPKPIPKTKERDTGVASITPRAATEPQRNGGKDVYTRLYQNAAPARKRRDEYGESTRLLDNAAPHAPAPAIPIRHEAHKSSPRASKDVQKLQTRPAEHVINMPLNGSKRVAWPVLGQEPHGNSGDQWPPLHLSGGDSSHRACPALHSDLLPGGVVLGGSLGDPPRLNCQQVHPVLVRASVLNQWGSQPRDVGSQRQLDVQGFNKPHPHHLPPLQAWPRNSRPHHQGPQYTSSPHPSLPYTRSYLPSPQHSWPHHLRPHHPLPMFRPKPHQRAHPSQAISLSRRARIYAQPKRPGILNYCCSVL